MVNTLYKYNEQQTITAGVAYNNLARFKVGVKLIIEDNGVAVIKDSTCLIKRDAVLDEVAFSLADIPQVLPMVAHN